MCAVIAYASLSDTPKVKADYKSVRLSTNKVRSTGNPCLNDTSSCDLCLSLGSKSCQDDVFYYKNYQKPMTSELRSALENSVQKCRGMARTNIQSHFTYKSELNKETI